MSLIGHGFGGIVRYQVWMEEPSLRSSRLALAGGIAAAVIIAGGGFLFGRVTSERTEVVIAPVPIASTRPQATPSPEPRGILGRADLIALAASATDRFAAGGDPGEATRDADGRRFELRLPFGCNGPAEADSKAAMRWRYDAEARALRIHAAPVSWRAEDWWSTAPEGIEGVEGFWLMRPWTGSDSCPATSDRPSATGAEAVTLPGQTLAIGQILSLEGTRRGRRNGQPYEAVVRVPADELDTSKGFRLRIIGRVVAAPNGGTVRCQQPAGAEQRPICLIATAFEQVSVENAATGDVVATWDAQGSAAN
ncbi:hypothetical protein [Sphingomonas sp. LT1P40]|uniref:hypothetical protein n=1 Tax=Alteristakelama amylovorans TaxID=3096166 RepID=UPI002FCA461D